MSILIYFATIFWSLFPNLIHVFQGGDNFINKVNATNLVVNGDLSVDSNNDNIPDGFAYNFVTEYSLVDGIFTFTANEQYANFRYINSDIFAIDSIYYIFSSFKSPSANVRLLTTEPNAFSNHSGNNEYEYHSFITKKISTSNAIYIEDRNISAFTPIEVNYIGAYNVSQMITNGVKNDSGISFSDLTDQEIQSQLDLWITEYGNLDFKLIYDNTADSWFDTGFVEKAAERDFLDYLGYFVWLLTPPIILFATLDLLRRVI